MARAKRDTDLEHRTNRLKLACGGEPKWAALALGAHIGYYRPLSRGAGSWRGRYRDVASGVRKKVMLGTADDYEDADGIRILNWMQVQAKARIWFADLARETRRVADGGSIHDGPYTVGVALDDYRTDCERRGLKGMRVQNYQVEAHIRPALGGIELAKLTWRQVEKWLTSVANSPKRRTFPKRGTASPKPALVRRVFKVPRPPKPELPAPAPPSTPEQKRARKDTANRVFAILRAALNLSVARRLYRGDRVWMEVDLYENTKAARMRFLAIADQVRIVRACPPDFQRLVKGALYTGARYGELTHINVSEYNREAQTIFIPGHLSKSGKARHIFLTLEGVRCFEAITAGRQSTEPMFVRDGVVKRVCPGNSQSWMAGDQKHPMEAAYKSAGLARITFHELRHTAASTWIAAGMDLIIVARQLGHADTRMVEQHYGHLCPTAAAARFRSIAPELGLEGPELVMNLLIKTS